MVHPRSLFLSTHHPHQLTPPLRDFITHIQNQSTPLHKAVDGGHDDVVARLLKAGADVDVQSMVCIVALLYWFVLVYVLFLSEEERMTRGRLRKRKGGTYLSCVLFISSLMRRVLHHSVAPDATPPRMYLGSCEHLPYARAAWCSP